MNTLLIFGAGRGTGHLLLQQALAADLRCFALVRNEQTANTLNKLGAHTVVGDALNAPAVEKICQAALSEQQGRCTLVSTMGGGQANYTANRIVIDTAEQCGISRMVLLTSLGCGSSWPYSSDRAKAAFGFSVREKSLAETWLMTSTLDYSILRPGGLQNGSPSNNAQCYPHHQEIHGYVYRSDLAKIILEKTQQPVLGCCIHSVVDPTLTPEIERT